jgi:hypothetical protein
MEGMPMHIRKVTTVKPAEEAYMGEKVHNKILGTIGVVQAVMGLVSGGGGGGGEAA